MLVEGLPPPIQEPIHHPVTWDELKASVRERRRVVRESRDISLKGIQPKGYGVLYDTSCSVVDSLIDANEIYIRDKLTEFTVEPDTTHAQIVDIYKDGLDRALKQQALYDLVHPADVSDKLPTRTAEQEARAISIGYAFDFYQTLKKSRRNHGFTPLSSLRLAHKAYQFEPNTVTVLYNSSRYPNLTKADIRRVLWANTPRNAQIKLDQLEKTLGEKSTGYTQWTRRVKKAETLAILQQASSELGVPILALTFKDSLQPLKSLRGHNLVNFFKSLARDPKRNDRTVVEMLGEIIGKRITLEDVLFQINNGRYIRWETVPNSVRREIFELIASEIGKHPSQLTSTDIIRQKSFRSLYSHFDRQRRKMNSDLAVIDLIKLSVGIEVPEESRRSDYRRRIQGSPMPASNRVISLDSPTRSGIDFTLYKVIGVTDSGYEEIEETDLLLSKLTTLPNVQQSIMIGVIIDELSIPEIAIHLLLTQEETQAQYDQAVRSLQIQMQKTV